MIDWYLILLIGMVVLISNMKYFGEHQTKGDYLYHKNEFGLSEGTFRILFGTISGTAVVLPIYFLEQIGSLGGFVLALTGLFSLYGYSILAKRIKLRLIDIQHNIQTIKPLTKKLIVIVLIIINLEGLIVQTLLAEEVLTRVLSVPAWTALLLICFSSFIFAGLGGSIGLQRVGTFLIVCLFLGVTVNPISLYLTQGIHPTLMALESAIPSFLKTDIGNLFLYVFAAAIIMNGYLLSNVQLSTSLLRIKEKRLKLSVQISAFCWMSVPLAFTSIYIYFIGQSGSTSFFYTSLLERLSAVLLYLLIISALSVFLMSAGNSIFSVAVLLISGKEKPDFQKLYIGLAGIAFLPFLLHLSADNLLEISIIFFGNLFAACFPIFYYFLRNERETELGLFIPASLIGAATFGSFFSFYTSFVQGVLISFAFALICILINKIAWSVNYSEK
ncbi:hypothetical protein EVU96_12465 [Bacillus infantis]|uniref:hypothetical protein n=1 Tax=Bacillus infantis TaxID=324767 RepID=UPI00101B67BA|nr:hypothetical protein [Bacillus infantis]RYI28743.1 hypothetical protein EVU96_12465 [Bacillus infantis]